MRINIDRNWTMRNVTLVAAYEQSSAESRYFGAHDIKRYFDQEQTREIIPNDQFEILDTLHWLVDKGLAERDESEGLERFCLSDDGIDLVEVNGSAQSYIAGRLGIVLPPAP